MGNPEMSLISHVQGPYFIDCLDRILLASHEFFSSDDWAACPGKSNKYAVLISVLEFCDGLKPKCIP